MSASSLSFRAAVLLGIIGMSWGIYMGISQDHSTMPAHAHLNLLGWVSLFLFGVFYRLHPALDSARIALVQIWIWIAATIVLIVGVAMVHSGRGGEMVAAIGSLIVVSDMALFGWLVMRSQSAAA